MVEMHPETVAALGSSKEFIHTIDEMQERIDRIRARRPSPTSRVIPEVDAEARLTNLYIAPGTLEIMTRQQLTAEIVGAIQESTIDALRQHRLAVQATEWPQTRRAGQ